MLGGGSYWEISPANRRGKFLLVSEVSHLVVGLHIFLCMDIL